MTNKQEKTLVLFAQNYSLPIIAKKQKVSLTAIRVRIKSLSRNHQKEFNNALILRKVYKKNREAIRALRHTSTQYKYVNLEKDGEGMGLIQYKF